MTYMSSEQCVGFFKRLPCCMNLITSAPLRPAYGVEAVHKHIRLLACVHTVSYTPVSTTYTTEASDDSI